MARETLWIAPVATSGDEWRRGSGFPTPECGLHPSGRCCIWSVRGVVKWRYGSGVSSPRRAHRTRRPAARSPALRPPVRSAPGGRSAQGVPGDHDAGAAVLLEPAHRSQPRFEAAVVSLDAVVGVLLGAMPGHRQQLVQHRRVGRRSVGDDLDRDRRCRADGLLEEPSAWGARSRCVMVRSRTRGSAHQGRRGHVAGPRSAHSLPHRAPTAAALRRPGCGAGGAGCKARQRSAGHR
jgi:hypothetical protein